MTLFISTWIFTCAEGNVNHTLFKQIYWGNGWIICDYMYTLCEVLHEFQCKWLSFFICLLIVCSEGMCPSSGAIFVKYPSFWYSTWRVSQTLTPDDNFKKCYSESILNRLTIFQKQIIDIFTNHFCLNRENVFKITAHWLDESTIKPVSG